MDQPQLRTLLYRYFFFGWLFKDATSGNLFERAAVLRSNREQAARWLPLYMLRWLKWSVALYLVAGILEVKLDAAWWATWFYAGSVVGVTLCVTAATAWLGMTQRREPQ